MDLQELNQRFGLPGVRFVPFGKDLTAVEVENSFAAARLSLYGAQMLSFTPKGGEDLLWMSGSSWLETGKAIRGGAPVCWPWFGGSPVAGRPAHGLARISNWHVAKTEVLADGSTLVLLALTPAEAPEGMVDFDFALEFAVTIGKTLTMALKCRNLSSAPAPVSAAIHTYFSVGAAEKIRISGLDGLEFLNKVPGAASPTGKQQGDITISSEVDWVFCPAEGAVEISDPVKGRKIRVEKSGSRSTVVWNPWIKKSAAMPDFGDEEYHTMVCVEAANAAADARVLAPGEEHVLLQKIGCSQI